MVYKEKKGKTSNFRLAVCEKLIEIALFSSSSISVFVVTALTYIFFYESAKFFSSVSIVEFLTGTKWAPLYKPSYFGVLPLVAGTFLTTIIGLVIAVPIGILMAIYLSQFADARIRNFIKIFLEILYSIPTIVYGYLALLVLTPILKKIFPDIQVFNALSAGIMMGFMLLPIIASLSDDAMSSVPKHLKEAALALGSTKIDVALRVVLPASMSGIIASIILAVSRAVGETMIVAIAAGSTPNLTLNPLKSVQTMTAFIAQVSMGDAPQGSVEYQSIFAVGFVLFLITLLLNIIGKRISRWKTGSY